MFKKTFSVTKSFVVGGFQRIPPMDTEDTDNRFDGLTVISNRVFGMRIFGLEKSSVRNLSGNGTI